MNRILFLCIACLLSTVDLMWADAPEAEDQMVIAQRIIIPRTVMHLATVKEALEWTGKKSQFVDPANKGVHLILTGIPDPKEGEAAETIVTYDLTNFSVWDIIQRVARLGNLKVTATKDAITFQPAAPKK